MRVKRRRENPVEISVGDVVRFVQDSGVTSYANLLGQVGVVVAVRDMGPYLQSLATVRFFTQDRTWSVYAHRLEVLDAQDR